MSRYVNPPTIILGAMAVRSYAKQGVVIMNFLYLLILLAISALIVRHLHRFSRSCSSLDQSMSLTPIMNHALIRLNSAPSALLLLFCCNTLWAGDWSPEGEPGTTNNYTRASNQGGIINTRHNLTYSYITGYANAMTPYQNKYGEVCVYCHTPHGAANNIKAPLWNRTVNPTSAYNTYEGYRLNGPVDVPGPASLACLSCHDGTLPVDSVMNMPGSNGYSRAQQGSVNTSFLDTWNNPDSTTNMGFGTPCGDSPCFHASMGAEGNGSVQSGKCMRCHQDGNNYGIPAFSGYIIGTDLRNDHPVGVAYPDPPETFDFRPGMAALSNGSTYFDDDNDGHMDSNEVRLYDVGGGPMVECASCHDPHGVPSAGAGSEMAPSFLRFTNEESAMCYACHVK